MTRSVEQRAVDTIRVLSMDAVQKANSGHPGMPMGMADIAVVLWGKFLNVDPADPTWKDRDRFVLSNGHGSMLLYSLLHLSGFGVSMEDIENFRQWGYETAGHPEVNQSIGIETTTGPLGQGFGVAVGMAIAEAHQRAIHGDDLIDHFTYTFCGDGDVMEGVASEAASLAGHLGLGRLIVFYDDNSITIDGSTDLSFSEDVPARFEAYGWHTLTVDGHDRSAIEGAIREARTVANRPTLISCKTHIGFGAPSKVDTSSAHGAPLGDDEIAGAKAAMGWDVEPFAAPDDVYEFFAQAMQRGRDARMSWESRVADLAGTKRLRGFEAAWSPEMVNLDPPAFEAGTKVATRKQSEAVIQQLAELRPDMIGGSADLAGSNNTKIKASDDFSADNFAGRNLNFGIREHAMGTIVNGITQHGGLRGYGATFLTFSDYMRASIRLAALMELPSILVFTHDSIFLGEDGPTHQSIEHLSALRLIPNLTLIRPADPTETAWAWEAAVNNAHGPTAITLTRQGLPIPDEVPDRDAVRRGGYVRMEGTDCVVIATGSEVATAEGAAALLGEGGLSVRVVSMPSLEVFAEQPADYRASVLGTDLPVFSLEAGSTALWLGYTVAPGHPIGIDRFGVSAPASVLADKFGFTPEAVADTIRRALAD